MESPIHTYFAFARPPEDRVLKSHILRMIEHEARNPDKGSEFEQSTQRFKHLKSPEFLAKLESFGYDALVLVQDDDVIGLVAFQDHADGSRHSFKYWVPKYMRGKKIGKLLVRTFLETAMAQGIFNVRIYAGNIRNELSEESVEAMRSMAEHLPVDELPFVVERGTETGWVILRPRSN